MKIFLSALSVAALISSIPIQAQQTEEIIVVANRIEQPLSDSMASVEVIGREEIAASQAKDLLDLLSGRNGVNLARDGGAGKNTSLFMRGTDSDHTLIYIDNQPINGLADGRARLEYLPLDQFERIEIVRGARSSLYGSEAIGGVVRLFTRKSGEQPYGGNLSLTGGSHGYQSAAVNGYREFGSTSLQAGVSYTDTDGIDARIGANPDKDGYQNQSYNLGIQHEFVGGHSVSLNHSRTDSESSYDDSFWFPGGADGEDDYQRLNTSLQADLVLSDRWTTSVSLAKFEDEAHSVGAFGPFISDSSRDSASLMNEYRTDGWIATLGVDFDHDTYISNFLNEEDRDNLAAVGHVSFNNERFPVAVSLRNDWNEQYGSHATGNLSMGWNSPSAGEFWVSIGTAFKAPNFFDLYGFGGDPNLEPEKSRTIELGWRGNTESLTYTAAIFKTDTENLIEFDNLLFQIFNRGDVEIKGLELGAEAEWSEFQLGISYTYLDHENLDTGDELVRRPRNTMRVDVGRQIGDLNIMLIGLAQSQRSDIGNATLDGYQIADLLLSYSLLDNLRVQGKVGNMFDQDYQLVSGFRTEGRTYQAALSYSF